MSVTFSSDVPGNSTKKDEPCLCAQMSNYFSDFFQEKDSPEIRKDLKENADPKCYMCHGTGIETVEVSDTPTMNLANDNACIFLNILGLNPEYGEISLPEARRALMRGLSKDLSKYTRESETIYGKPTEIEPGVYDMKPLKMYSAGLPVEQLQRYLERFKNFLHDVWKAGGTKIYWG